MSAADLITRIDAARGDHQRASDLLAEARGRSEPLQTPPQPPEEEIEARDILENYQVQNDEIDPFLGFFGRDITVTEVEMLGNLTPVDFIKVSNIRNQAIEEAVRQLPSENVPDHVPDGRQDEWLDNDGHQDAFRHAYANSLLTQEFGEPWASQFTTAHEALPGIPADREAMDLYNNEVGRRIAVDNPNANPEELSNLVRQALDNGELIVLNQNGDPVWSNDERVPPGQHGLANDPPGEGGQPLPDGEAPGQS